MSTRLWKLLLFTALIAAAVSYLFFLNPEPAVVHWGRGAERTWTTPMALLLVVVFFGGAAAAAAIAVLIGLRVQWLQWQAARLQRARDVHQHRLVIAREELALGNTEAARKDLSAVLQRDPADIHARICFADSLRNDGKVNEAIRILEQAPLEQKSSREILMKLADLHLLVGNRLAACDALRLLLARDPKNTMLLRQLSDISQEIGKFHDSVDYAEQLVRAARSPEERTTALERLALAELLRVKADCGADRPLLREQLTASLKRHHDFGPTLLALAQVEREDLNLEAAHKLYARAFRSERTVEILHEISQLWLSVEDPRRALASLRNLVTDPGTAPKLDGQLLLAGMLLFYGDADEAKAEVARCRALPGVPPERAAEISVLEGMAAKRGNNADLAAECLFQAVGTLLPHSPLQLLGNSSLGPLEQNRSGWAEQARLAYRSEAAPAPRLLGS